jgi:hypothetical protein
MFVMVLLESCLSDGEICEFTSRSVFNAVVACIEGRLLNELVAAFGL